MSARKWFALLSLGWIAFAFVGSVVPFDFRHRTWNDATRMFVLEIEARVRPHSKSDFVANVMVGVPLGFGLLGMLCADRRRNRFRAALLGLLVLPVCMTVTTTVEFAQTFTRDRFAAGSDIIAQTIGAILGIGGWVLCGQWLTDQVRKAATGADPAARFLVGYVLFLGFVQALPLDVNTSPADAYRKFRDGGVNPIPFREFRKLTEPEALGRVATLLKLAGLYLPVGLLAGCIPRRFWARENIVRVFFAAMGLALTYELGQVVIASGTTSATDVLIGGGAAFLGWAMVKTFRHGLVPHHTFFLGMAWWWALVWVSWQPFEPGPPVAFDWIPGMPLQGGNPLFALEEMLTKLALFGILGVVLASSIFHAPPRSGLAVAATLGLLTSAVLEFVQTRFAGHTPCITDVLLGGLGAFCGAWLTKRVGTRQELLIS